MVNVPADSVYRMGVNSVDRAEIRVDGRRIVTVAGCGRAFPREVAYDTYLFNDYVSLKLTRGEHRVDILSTGKISFGLVDSLDFQVRNVSYIVIEHENKAKEFRIPIKRRLRLQNIPMPSGIMPMVLQCWDCWLWPMRRERNVMRNTCVAFAILRWNICRFSLRNMNVDSCGRKTIGCSAAGCSTIRQHRLCRSWKRRCVMGLRLNSVGCWRRWPIMPCGSSLVWWMVHSCDLSLGGRSGATIFS